MKSSISAICASALFLLGACWPEAPMTATTTAGPNARGLQSTSRVQAVTSAVPTKFLQPDIDLTTAQSIAHGFILHIASLGQHSEWMNARLGSVTPYYGDDDTLQAYECEVLSEHGAPQGWVMVDAWETLGPISAYSTEGITQTNALREIALHYHAGQKLLKQHYLWNGPGSAAIRIEDLTGTEITLDGQGAASDALFDGMQRIRNSKAYVLEMQSELAQTRLRSIQALRHAYMTADFSNPLLRGATVSVFSAGTNRPESKLSPAFLTVGSGEASFSHFKQEQRVWRNSSTSVNKCMTGCTPVAFGIVLEYWDRNGYPKMVGSDTDNSNTAYDDPDVVWMLDELRWNLHTGCELVKGVWQGETASWYYSRVQDHVNSRGVGTWTADTTRLPLSRWNVLMAEISAGRPAVVHYDVNKTGGGINHSAAAYEYTDNPGDINDWICAEKGWYTSGITRDCFTTGQAGEWQITSLKH